MRAFTLALAFFVLAACGGGGGGGGGSVTPPPPPPADADPGGLWFGTLAYDNETFEELVGITTADGRFTFISLDTFGPDTFGQYIGTATVAGSDITGAGKAYAAPGSSWGNGGSVLDITLTAVVVERTSLSGSWQTSSGETVTFELVYDAEYEKDSALAFIDGVWFVYDDALNPTLTLTVESDGSFSGQNSAGCVSLGQISIIDANFNVYGWDVVISNCPIAGDYSGVALLFDLDTGDPNNSENNAVLVSISNDLRALLLPLER